VGKLLKMASKIYTILDTSILHKKCTAITVLQGHHVTYIKAHPGVKDVIVLLDGWHLGGVFGKDVEFAEDITAEEEIWEFEALLKLVYGWLCTILANSIKTTAVAFHDERKLT
jgi:hypothetical protein